MTNEEELPAPAATVDTSPSHLPQEVKCVVVGDAEVGKTRMLLAYATNFSPDNYTPAVFDQWKTNVVVDSRQFQLCLCDTPGHETYDRLRPLSYPQTSVFLLCFSMANPTSLENIREKWCPEVKHHQPLASVILVGIKADSGSVGASDGGSSSKRHSMDSGTERASRQRARDIAKEIKAVKYLECSVLTLHGLKDVFEQAVLSGLKAQKGQRQWGIM